MNKELTSIVIQSIGRNAIQFLIGFCAALWWATNNMDATAQVKTLIGSLAPFVVSIGGTGTLAMSIYNSVTLLKTEPPKP
jgi:hypothetical protein